MTNYDRQRATPAEPAAEVTDVIPKDDNKRDRKTDDKQTATKKLTIVVGKGTTHERRVESGITLYWSAALGRYVSIPD